MSRKSQPKSKKIFVYTSFGETIEFAENIGWIDKHGDSKSGDWSPAEADHCEADALEYIKSKGYEITKARGEG